MSTGCSSNVARFNSPADLFTTASTSNQREIIDNQNQPYPGDTAAAPVDGVETASVSRSELPPPGAAPAASAPVSPETTVASAPVAKRKSGEPEPAKSKPGGATQVTVKEGETIYSLSRRYGVPASVIAQANGLPKDGMLKIGQTIAIPGYAYSTKTTVAAAEGASTVKQATASSEGTLGTLPPRRLRPR
jgi:LysM repeat protein